MKSLPRLTSRGLTLLLGGAGLVAAGAVSGFVDVMRAGAFAVVLVALMYVLVLVMRPGGVSARRGLRPVPASVGTPSDISVQLTVKRTGWLPVRLRDAGTFGGDAWSDPRLRRGQASRNYTVTAPHRGELTAGPLSIAVSDPLGLVDSRTSDGTSHTWLVWPRIYAFDGATPSALGLGEESLSQTAFMPGTSVGSGVREYAQGDDVRLIHWAASAHHGELMVRQMDPPARPTVLLALTGGVDDIGQDADWEWLVSAAASLFDLLDRSAVDVDVRLGPARPTSYGQTMDELARIRSAPLDGSVNSRGPAALLLHSSSASRPAPPARQANCALVSGPDAQRAARDLTRLGWRTMTVSADDDGAAVLTDVLASLGGGRA